jgi:hypothetical protein
VELNQFVKIQTSGLETRGEQTSDLLVNLFKAYKACGDAEFVCWVSHKEDSYFEGSLTITPIEIMSWADNKYKTQLEAGRWMQSSPAQKRIVALTAQLAALEKARTPAKPPPKKVTFDKRSQKKKAPPTKGKERGWEWTLVGPKPGQPHTKDVDGKHFRWCTYHDDKGSGGKWVTHTHALCKVRLALEAKKTGRPMGGTDAQMKVAGMVAMMTIEGTVRVGITSSLSADHLFPFSFSCSLLCPSWQPYWRASSTSALFD